jgi:S1-C subfamily serine protease
MANGLVIHIESGSDKHTEVVTSDRIIIGTDDRCDVRVRAGSLPQTDGHRGAIIELSSSNGHYRVAGFSQSLKASLNGSPLEIDSRIEDGDRIEIEDCDLSLQFFPVGGLAVAVARSAPETHVAPFIENAAIESAATARRDDAKVFLREFTRELVREIKLSTKVIALVFASLIVGGILYIGLALYNEVQNSHRLINDQRDQMRQMSETVKGTNAKLGDIDRSNIEIRDSLSLAPKLRNDFGGGVCLISGSFYFVEGGTGRPLRYLETQTSEDGTVIQSGNDSTQLTPEGNGAIAEFEFVGTGFHVGGGYVLTNRHVAQPWLADERAQTVTSSVNGQPRLKRLVAFFPSHPQAMGLKFKQSSTKDDLAVCALDSKDPLPPLPVLPMDSGSDAVVVGKQVIMMGYPSGPDRLLALLDDSEARSVQSRYGSSLESLLDFLSTRNRIQPLTTQGHITDLDVRRIVYDARTAEGGSGAPLFGTSGRVIGINFAVFTENTASNFAVPSRYAIALLQRSGWKSPEPVGENTAESTNSNQNSNRVAGGSPPAKSPVR